jgi:hypothetical protein
MKKTARDVLKMILIALGGMVLLVLVLFAMLAGYMIHGSSKAEEAAKAFCNTVKIGADIDAVTAAATRTSYPNRQLQSENEYWFSFQGGIFYAGVCKVSAQNGKVTAKRFEASDD